MQDEPHSAFGAWTQVHKKVYETEDEHARRYAIWLDNLDYVESYNSRHSTHWVRLPVAKMVLRTVSEHVTCHFSVPLFPP